MLLLLLVSLLHYYTINELGLTGQFRPSPIVLDVKQIMIGRPLIKIIAQSLVNNILDGGILGRISLRMFIPDQDFPQQAGFDL